MPKLNVDVREIHEAGYNVQRTEKWFCAIVSSKTGESVLKVVILPSSIVVLNRETFSCSHDEVHITLKEGKPVAECGNKLIWAI